MQRPPGAVKQVAPTASAGRPSDEARPYPDADEFRAVAGLTTPTSVPSPPVHSC